MLSQNPNNRYETIGRLKEDINIKGNATLAAQKVSELEGTIIADSVIEDELIENPVEITSFDHRGGNLICTLNHPIPRPWQEVFYARGASSWSSTISPTMTSFNGRELLVYTPIEHAEQALGFAKTWVKGTNDAYRQVVHEQQQRDQIQKKRELEARVEEERRRAEFLKKARL